MRIGNKKYIVKKCRNHGIGMMFQSWKKFDAMLFSFPFKAKWGSLWMPFCPKMDILFIDDNTVIHKVNAIPMTLDPRTWKMYRSPKKYNKLIEIRSDNNVKIGDKIEWK